ncbi:pre-rRNA-processing protein ESF2, putative [Entamoeba dispar SAW760]|uniref:Pre-rRNA-processing protein ESF2, putative n=1 Tax=Entamoeba dispar (strain ATCC PRA-260 / SAW760) TaxID=370354 RepID=B0EGJ0_ENTDS|nr:pre-rRNA-processing protein ESF2, putative [Entamoeba dispar SAW760]EDR26369.1 pre-rRNA-processing protein ESF2, putative [Entamoeba dispar SAW760]|eukprot:EDR26369.1 pre-rRNA-processing protein ESF2, putative [Entamoeba dispar SAW760]
MSDNEISDLLEDLGSEDLEEIEEDEKKMEEDNQNEMNNEDDKEEKNDSSQTNTKPINEESEEPHGIIYLSVVHKGLNPGIIKGIFSNYGKVSRMHFIEDKKKKGIFKEAWIEFETEKQAKLVALMLNGKVIGGKNRHSPFADKIWNIRFIKGLSWGRIFEDKESKQISQEQQIEFAKRKVKKETESYLASSKKVRNSKFARRRRERKANQLKEKEETAPKKNEE